MIILVRPRHQIIETVQLSKVSHQLKIQEFHDKETESQSPTHLVIKFDDVEFPSEQEAVTVGQIKQVIAWLSNIPNTATLLVSCFAGTSRSPAVALIAHYLAETKAGIPDPATEDLIAAVITSCHGIPSPNGLVLSYADSLLQTNGKLLEVYWKMKDAS